MEVGRVLELMLRVFERAGYVMSWKQYNLANYGVPQMQKRIILVGMRSDLRVRWSPPLATHASRDNIKRSIDRFLPLERRRTIRPWVPVREAFTKIIEDTSERARGKINNTQSRYKVNWDEPCRYTILASSTKIPIHPDYAGSMKIGTFPKRLSVNECKVLQTIPLDFPVQGPKTVKFRLIGNAVPPVFSGVLARQIVKILSPIHKT